MKTWTLTMLLALMAGNILLDCYFAGRQTALNNRQLLIAAPATR